MTAVLATGIFVVTYVLIATERVHRVAAALGGAAAMVLIGVVDADSAFFSEETGIDWNKLLAAADLAAQVPGGTPGGRLRGVPAVRRAA